MFKEFVLGNKQVHVECQWSFPFVGIGGAVEHCFKWGENCINIVLFVASFSIAWFNKE